MKIGNWEVRRAKGEERSAKSEGARLGEAELQAALAVSDGNLQWRAMLQLLDDFEEGVRLNIGTDPSDKDLVHWNAAGADYIAQFKERLQQERVRAKAGFARDPARLKRIVVSRGMRDGSGRRPEDEQE